MQMYFRQFSRNNTYVSIPVKMSEIHFHAWLFSNPCGNVLIVDRISWSPDLRMQHMNTMVSAKMPAAKLFFCPCSHQGGMHTLLYRIGEILEPFLIFT